MKGYLWYFMFEVKSETSYLTSQMRILVLWDVTMCCWVSGSWHFKGTHYLHCQGSVVFIHSWPLKMKVTHSFKKYRTNTATQCHITENQNPRLHCCENIKTCTVYRNLMADVRWLIWEKCISVIEVAKCYEVKVSTSWFRSNWLTDWLHEEESFLRS
jgi:hypothetical protein